MRRPPPADGHRGPTVSRHLPLLADRLLNRPLLIHPAKAMTILSVLEGRITLDGTDAAVAPDASRFKGGQTRPDGQRTQYTRIAGDTAIVSVVGSLVNRGAWIGAASGLTSYEGIAAQIDEIADDATIRSVVLDIDSYGGEATGMAGLAARIRGLRDRKHVVAVVNDVAASAGYGIASAADEIVVSPTSVVGSIGVVMLHMDRSREMEALGLKPTLIHAGAKKVDGHPFGPLPDHVRADMQKDVMAFYEQFLATVEVGRGYIDARRRSRLTAEQARATEADTYIGEEAIRIGLADRLGSLDDVLATLSRPARAAGRQSRGDFRMDRNDMPSASAGDVTETALRAARLEGEAAGTTVGRAEGRAEGHAEGVAAERARIAAIIGSAEGKARPAAALALALADDSPKAETAIKLLGALPEERPAAVPAVPSIGQRSAGAEIGAAPMGGGTDGAEAARRSWSKIVAQINAAR